MGYIFKNLLGINNLSSNASVISIRSISAQVSCVSSNSFILKSLITKLTIRPLLGEN